MDTTATKGHTMKRLSPLANLASLNAPNVDTDTLSYWLLSSDAAVRKIAKAELQRRGEYVR